METLEGDQVKHLAYIQGLPSKDMKRLWRSLPQGQKRLLRDFHMALRARSVTLASEHTSSLTHHTCHLPDGHQEEN